MSRLITSFLGGKHGLEIGAAAHNDFHLNTLNVSIGGDVYDDYQRSRGYTPARIDIHADAANIPVPDNSQDFVFSSHMIEHHPNPMRAIKEWYRVVKIGGHIAIIVPHRDALDSDKDKPLTTLDEQLERYFSNYLKDEPDSHFSRWTTLSFLEMVQAGNLMSAWNLVLKAAIDPDDQVGNGFTIVLGVIK